MTTFVLVHGAWLGGWCWERVLPELEALGYRGLAPDLPGEDPDAGLADYAEAVARQSADADGDVIAVGHSANGLVLPLVAAARPLRALVYLDAFVPVPGSSMADQFAASDEPILLFEDRREIDAQGRSAWLDPEAAGRSLFSDLTPEDAAWAFAKLRPQAPRPQREPCPDGLPGVPAHAIVNRDDRVLNPAWASRVARERLGTEPVDLPGGHFSMLTEPRALAAALAATAA